MRNLFLAVCLLVLCAGTSAGESVYKYEETRKLVALVKEAASVIQTKGEAVFPQFKEEGSKWRHDDTYIFIIDADGNMVLHPDPALEGKNELALKDVNNKFIIKGLIDAVAGEKKEGWFHYQWPEPGSLFPLWKSSFVQLVTAPKGKKYAVGSGLYNMRMEKEFVVALVDSAAELVKADGEEAFSKLRDKAGPFVFMDIYVFVDRTDGVELVNGAFPNLEGRSLMDYRDKKGKYLVHDYIDLALTKGSGWVDYLWPKPQESVPSLKHTYIKKVEHGNEIFIVGAGTYLEN